MGVLGASKLPIAFYMKDISLKFLRPVYADKPFQIESHVYDQNETTAFVKSQMIGENEKVHATCDWTIVSVDKLTGKTCPWLDNFMDIFYE